MSSSNEQAAAAAAAFSSSSSSTSISCRPERYADVAQLLGELRQFSSVFGPAHGANISQCAGIMKSLYVFICNGP